MKSDEVGLVQARELGLSRGRRPTLVNSNCSCPEGYRMTVLQAKVWWKGAVRLVGWSDLKEWEQTKDDLGMKNYSQWIFGLISIPVVVHIHAPIRGFWFSRETPFFNLETRSRTNLTTKGKHSLKIAEKSIISGGYSTLIPWSWLTLLLRRNVRIRIRWKFGPTR